MQIPQGNGQLWGWFFIEMHKSVQQANVAAPQDSRLEHRGLCIMANSWLQNGLTCHEDDNMHTAMRPFV